MANGSLGARDFSSAVSGFFTAEDVSAFGQHRKFPPHERKTSGTQGRQIANVNLYHITKLPLYFGRFPINLTLIIKHSVSAYRRKQLEPVDIEAVGIDVKGRANTWFSLLACYRSPNKNKPT